MIESDLLESVTTYYIAGAFMMLLMTMLLNHFHRRAYLFTWALSWAVVLVGYLVLYYGYVFELDILLWLYGVFVLIAVFLQQRGVYMVIDRPYPADRFYVFAGMLITYFALSGIFPHSSWPAFSVFAFAGVLYLDAALALLRTRKRPFVVYGSILAVYAALIALFPHTGAFATPTNITYTLFLVFGMAVAYGMVAMHLINIHSEEQAMHDKLYHLSFHDHLTGLRNRVYLESFLNTLDENKDVKASIMMADLDTLKVINDRYGHAAGDAMIMQAGEILAETTEETDLLVRYGGDEFVVLYANRDETQMEETMRHIRKRTKEEKVEGVPLSFSIGHAVHNTDCSVYETLRKAERRMYENKRSKYTERTDR